MNFVANLLDGVLIGFVSALVLALPVVLLGAAVSGLRRPPNAHSRKE